ncbi:MAG: hypothetical protein ACSHXW_15995 [Yoonia sp.]
MISRLKTTNPELAEKINAAALSDAKATVLAILVGTLTAMPEKAAKLLPESFEVQSFKVTQDQIDALDDRYFDAEEKTIQMARLHHSSLRASWQRSCFGKPPSITMDSVKQRMRRTLPQANSGRFGLKADFSRDLHQGLLA